MFGRADAKSNVFQVPGTAPKGDIVIPNAVRNQVGKEEGELEYQSGLASFVPHCNSQ
jgi:hypothetical protein